MNDIITKNGTIKKSDIVEAVEIYNDYNTDPTGMFHSHIMYDPSDASLWADRLQKGEWKKYHDNGIICVDCEAFMYETTTAEEVYTFLKKCYGL